MNDSIRTMLKANSLCKICGDKASGKHYGVSSCDGCRGFFKRSIRRNLEYVCKEKGRCVVDISRRNQCQSCRFKKCLQVNMKREAVQHERAPRTSALEIPIPIESRYKNLHTSLFTNTILQPIWEGPAMYSNKGHYHLHNYPWGGTLGTPMLQNIYNRPAYQHPVLFPASRSTEDEVTSSEEVTNIPQEQNGLVLLNNAAGKPLFVSSLTLFPGENIYESAAKMLLFAIGWVQSIPSFLQLHYNDKKALLEESWGELFVLTASQWDFPVDEGFLVNNAIAPTTHKSSLEEDARRLRIIITKLILLRVDHTEHACLKALVLFKSGCRGLSNPNHIELLQDQTHEMLNEYCTKKKHEEKGRFGKLLLTLPAVQSVTRKGLQELVFQQAFGDVNVEKLLNEFCKSQ